MEINLDIYKILEDNNVFINYSTEHYLDGSNYCFYIEFKDYNTTTCLYNNNQEFGNVNDTIIASLKIALWYLDNPRRIELIKHNKYDDEVVAYTKEVGVFISSLFI